MSVAFSDRVFKSEKEWAKFLGVCRLTLHRARQEGRLSYSRIGKRVLISDVQIEKFVESEGGRRKE